MEAGSEKTMRLPNNRSPTLSLSELFSICFSLPRHHTYNYVIDDLYLTRNILLNIGQEKKTCQEKEWNHEYYIQGVKLEKTLKACIVVSKRFEGQKNHYNHDQSLSRRSKVEVIQYIAHPVMVQDIQSPSGVG